MLHLNYNNTFAKEVFSTQVGKHLMGLTIPGKNEAFFFRNNIKSTLSASSCPRSIAVLLDFQNKSEWKIPLSTENTIELISNQFGEKGLFSLADLVCQFKNDLVREKDSLFEYWENEIRPKLVVKSESIDFMSREKVIDVIKSCHPRNHSTRTCPSAINFIDNVWPSMFAEIQQQLIK